MIRRFLLLGALLAACNNGGKDTTDEETDEATTPDRDTALELDMNDSIDDAVDASALAFDELAIELIEQGTINPAGDRDFYAVELSEGAPYLIWAEAYDVATDTVILDPVIRVYNEDGDMIAENDDMVFRYRETDPAVFVNATYTGTYFIEVLEFGDWDSGDADGSFNHTYDLLGVRMRITEREGENETMEMVAPAEPDTDAAETDVAVDTDPSDDFLFIGSPVSTYASDFYGRIDSESDVDWWPVTVPVDETSPEDYTYLTFSMWPDVGVAPKMELFNAEGDLLAETVEPVPGRNSLVIDDVGMLARATEGETYFLKVSHNGGPTGTASLYPGIYFQYLPVIGAPEEEPNDTLGQPNFLAVRESTTTAGFYSGGASGRLPVGDTDVLVLKNADVSGLSGKFLSVVVRSTDIGSALDAKMTLSTADGTVLLSASVDAALEDHPDPVIRDYVPAANEDIYITIEADAETGADTARFWLVGIYLDETALFGN